MLARGRLWFALEAAGCRGSVRYGLGGGEPGVGWCLGRQTGREREREHSTAPAVENQCGDSLMNV